MPEDGPKEYPTAQLAAVRPEPATFEQKVLGALDGLRGEMKEIRTDTGSLVENARITNERLGRLELWRENVQERLGRSSERVRDVSVHDLAQEAKIAEEIIQRRKLEERVDKMAQEIVPEGKRSAIKKLSTENKIAIYLGAFTAAVLSLHELGIFDLLKGIFSRH